MLLEFTSQLEYKIDLLGSTSYRRITFSLQTFSKYVEPTCKPTNHYQLKKLLNFLTSVQSNSFATYFYSGEFSRLATIPKITFEKSKTIGWCIDIWVVEDLFNHCYPFVLPNFFNVKLKKYEFSARLWFMQTFNSTTVEKIFNVEDFFQSYSSTLSNGQKTLTKREFVCLVDLFSRSKLIEPRYKILTGDTVSLVSELTPSNISKGFVLYENFIL